MNIKCLDDTKWVNGKWDLSAILIKDVKGDLNSYTVQRGEDMRIDLVMKSIYDDIYTFPDIDIILYINNIDNPLNIREGMVLLYPSYESLEEYRYYEQVLDTETSKSVRQSLGVLNKTTRIDEKRKKFVDADYSLPPVVLPESRPSVVIDNNKIKIGGL